MRIGVLSDTHNNVLNLRKALQLFHDAGIQQLIHCGDMTSVATAQHMAGFDVIYVSGNVDEGDDAVRDAVWMLNPAGNETAASFSGKLDGVGFGVTHGHLPRELDRLIRARRNRFVFHGHTHRGRDERIGKTRVVNPGALGGARYEPRTVAIVDLAADDVQFVQVSDW